MAFMKVLNQMFTRGWVIQKRCKYIMQKVNWGKRCKSNTITQKQSSTSIYNIRFCFWLFWERGYFSMQLSNGGWKHIGVKTPLASCSYHTDVPFHYPPIRITLQNLACFYSPVIGFILRCPLLWSSLLFFFLFHLPPLPSSLFLLWLQAPLYLFSPLLRFQ